MNVWKPISEAPEDTLILLRKDFDSVETPLVVVGEVITFKGKKHHLWRGPYDQTIKDFSSVGDSETFTHYAEIGQLEEDN